MQNWPWRKLLPWFLGVNFLMAIICPVVIKEQIAGLSLRLGQAAFQERHSYNFLFGLDSNTRIDWAVWIAEEIALCLFFATWVQVLSRPVGTAYRRIRNGVARKPGWHTLLKGMLLANFCLFFLCAICRPDVNGLDGKGDIFDVIQARDRGDYDLTPARAVLNRTRAYSVDWQAVASLETFSFLACAGLLRWRLRILKETAST